MEKMSFNIFPLGQLLPRQPIKSSDQLKNKKKKKKKKNGRDPPNGYFCLYYIALIKWFHVETFYILNDLPLPW